MGKVITSDKHYKNIASLLRYAYDTDTQYKPSEMADSIRNLVNVDKNPDITNGIYYKNGLIIKTNILPYGMCAYLDAETFELPNCTEIPDNAFFGSSIRHITIPTTVEKIKGSAFKECLNLTEIVFPNSVIELGSSCFYQSGLTSIVLPSNITSIGSNCFYDSKSLVTAKIQGDVVLGTDSSGSCDTFNSCSALRIIDFCGKLENIYSNAFAYCRALTALILRNSTDVCALSNTKAFTSTPIASGTGYIYVPTSLLDSYKTANNWSTYANQFRALENYTVDGTVTGELDESKI